MIWPAVIIGFCIILAAGIVSAAIDTSNRHREVYNRMFALVYSDEIQEAAKEEGMGTEGSRVG